MNLLVRSSQMSSITPNMTYTSYLMTHNAAVSVVLAIQDESRDRGPSRRMAKGMGASCPTPLRSFEAIAPTSNCYMDRPGLTRKQYRGHNLMIMCSKSY